MIVALAALAFAQASKPNVIVVLCDDLGYGDLSSYGAKEYKTSHIDRLASGGVRFTQYYSGSPGCSPARAALLTGCYPQRVGVPAVLMPNAKIGLHPNEDTLPEKLRQNGYRTAIVGKWHLGDHPDASPLKHGFDRFFGLPYSNDMWPLNGKSYPRLWLMRDRAQIRPVDTLDDQASLTTLYTDEAIRFIGESQSKPFFLYLAHSMPHVPIGAAKPFRGKAPTLYGDTVLDIDASVGRLVAELKKRKLERETIIVFTSDNGPWRPYGDHAGSSGGLRGHKGTAFEGGMRVPMIVSWPGKIKPRTETGLAASMDLFPTLLRLSGSSAETRFKIDGKDLSLTLLAGMPSPRSDYFYYYPDQLKAVRSGPWKLHVPHSDLVLDGNGGTGGARTPERQERVGLSLYNLETDPGETVNLVNRYPKETEQLLLKVLRMRRELGDSLTRSVGSELRPPQRF